MMIELKTPVQVRVPGTSGVFVTIPKESKVNYSSNVSELSADIWVHRFNVQHPKTHQILEYVETIQGRTNPSWL